VANNPLPDDWMPQVIGRKGRIDSSITEPNTEATRTAEPTVLVIPDQRSTLNIAATAIHNVAGLDQVAGQSLGVFIRDTRNAIFADPVISDVLRHDGRNALGHIIGSMQLASERAGLYVSSATLAGFTE
jgi:hypothetical protein